MGGIFKKPKAPSTPPPPIPSPTPTPTPEIISSATEDARRKLLERRRKGFAATYKTAPNRMFALGGYGSSGGSVGGGGNAPSKVLG